MDAATKVDPAITHWSVTDTPRSLSVNAAHNVLVTCSHLRKIKEYTSRGSPLREIPLPDEIRTPWHAVQADGGQYIVCHGHLNFANHRVSKLSSDGRRTVQSHGGQSGPDVGQYDVPRHLAIDGNEFVYVVDILNRRVTLLSASLEYVGEVVSPMRLSRWPYRIALDVRRRRLYVSENDFEDGVYGSGRVLVFNV